MARRPLRFLMSQAVDIGVTTTCRSARSLRRASASARQGWATALRTAPTRSSPKKKEIVNRVWITSERGTIRQRRADSLARMNRLLASMRMIHRAGTPIAMVATTRFTTQTELRISRVSSTRWRRSCVPFTASPIRPRTSTLMEGSGRYVSR